MTASILYQSITALGSFTAFTSADDDYWALDPSRCAGLGDAPVRVTSDPAPGEDGVLIEAPLDDGQIITLVGDLVVTSTGYSSESGYFAAIDTLYGSLKSAIDAGKTAAIDLATAGATLKVWKNGPAEESWQNYWVCSVTASLIVDVFA